MEPIELQCIPMEELWIGSIYAFYAYGPLSTVCILKMVQSEEKNILDMIFVQNICVFGIISKRNNCSFCCF